MHNIRQEDAGSIPGSGKCPRGGNGNLLQYSCLGNPVAGGAWQAIVVRLQRVGYDLVTKQQQIIITTAIQRQVI